MKKILIILTSLIIMTSITACSLVPSVELTEDEQKVIAEYAAGLLLKYDKNYSGALEDIEEEEDGDVGIVQNEEAKMPILEEQTDPNVIESVDKEFSEDIYAEELAPSDEPEYSNTSISEAIGLEGFEVIYKSYETHKIYPEEESDNMVFSMQAQNGMELLILTFGITNDGDDTKMCDILGSDAGFRLLINGSERVNANKTILLNDLGSFSEEIDGYAMAEAVLVFEVSEGTSSSIDRLDLIVKKGDESTTHMLK